MKRLLITGSRDWKDRYAIAEAISEVAVDPREWTLVSGACPTGADRICEEVAHSLGMTVEIHPADWKTHGKRAGYIRNAEMVKRGADICLAFIKEESRGATMTADLAEKSDIQVRRFRS